jgi:hypothetical protein
MQYVHPKHSVSYVRSPNNFATAQAHNTTEYMLYSKATKRAATT